MAGSPIWKVYLKGTGYIASCKFAEDAAVLVSALGNGSQVRFGHRRVVWEEGKEATCAGESYDAAAAIMRQRAHKFCGY